MSFNILLEISKEEEINQKKALDKSYRISVTTINREINLIDKEYKEEYKKIQNQLKSNIKKGKTKEYSFKYYSEDLKCLKINRDRKIQQQKNKLKKTKDLYSLGLMRLSSHISIKGVVLGILSISQTAKSKTALEAKIISSIKSILDMRNKDD